MISLQAVANVPRQSGGDLPDKSAAVPFEEALKRLESIVESMESDDLPLETLLAKYEEGTRLAKACQDKLAAAEVRIQQLEKDAAGEIRLKPLSAEELKEP
jgi:exodeoxyribonuclease VII small subunit